MVRSQSKIRHIQEANKILENRMLFGRRLMEYDIDDDAMNSTIEQELSSKKFLEENSSAKIVGITNKKNLVFEHNGQQVKISPKGLLA